MATTKKGHMVKAQFAPLDNIFHYTKHGGTFGGEIGAGILMAIIAVCGVFMNMQLIGTLGLTDDISVADAGELYAYTYFVSMMASLIATLLIGILAGLPLAQTTSLGLSLVLVSIVGSATGLTLENLLFVNLVSAVVLVVVAVVPAVRDFCLKALPTPVRHALPAAMGAVLAWVCAQLSGVFTVTSSGLATYGGAQLIENASSYAMTSGIIGLSNYSFSTDKFHPQMILILISIVIALVVYLVGRSRSRHPLMSGLLVGTVFFLVTLVLFVGVNWRRMKLTFDFIWARAWMIGSEDAMQLHMSAVMSLLSPAAVLSEGSDFSAYTAAGGNVVLLFASALVTFLMLNLSSTMAVLDALDNEVTPVIVKKDGQLVAGKSVRESLVSTKVVSTSLLANGIGNIVAALIGASPVSVSPASVASAKDHARSWLATIVAAILIAVSCVFWVIPALFATATSYSIQLSQYGHYGVVFYYLTQCNFSIVDTVMIIVGVSMAVRAVMHACAAGPVRMNDAIAFATTVLFTLIMTNLAAGMAAGTIVYVATRLVPAKITARNADIIKRVGGIPVLVWCVLSIVVLVLEVLL